MRVATRRFAGIAVNPVTGAWSGTPSSFLSQTAFTVRALNEFGKLDASVDVQVSPSLGLLRSLRAGVR
jgi:hypothetical protein